eukprot:11767545-Ditylum_brightwellii.AAC.1
MEPFKFANAYSSCSKSVKWVLTALLEQHDFVIPVDKVLTGEFIIFDWASGLEWEWFGREQRCSILITQGKWEKPQELITMRLY